MESESKIWVAIVIGIAAIYLLFILGIFVTDIIKSNAQVEIKRIEMGCPTH